MFVISICMRIRVGVGSPKQLEKDSLGQAAASMLRLRIAVRSAQGASVAQPIKLAMYQHPKTIASSGKDCRLIFPSSSWSWSYTKMGVLAKPPRRATTAGSRGYVFSLFEWQEMMMVACEHEEDSGSSICRFIDAWKVSRCQELFPPPATATSWWKPCTATWQTASPIGSDTTRINSRVRAEI